MRHGTTRTAATARCSARAAIAGNPSDLHAGAVVATPLHSVAADVTVTAADVFDVDGGHHDSVDRLRSTVGHSEAHDSTADRPLVAASIVAAADHFGVAIPTVRVEVASTIPRGVGLAGSSAIVIATLRALCAHCADHAWAHTLALDPIAMASVALAAERDLLGITAGLQDRLVQSIDATVFMDFSAMRNRSIQASDVRRLPQLPGSCFVAYRRDRGTDSGAIHGAVDTGSPGFDRAMTSLAEQARHAARAIEARDIGELRRAMDTTFDLRRSWMDLDPSHVDMVTAVRSAGASATYTGSGGAVIILCDDLNGSENARDSLRALGCGLLPVP